MDRRIPFEAQEKTAFYIIILLLFTTFVYLISSILTVNIKRSYI